MRRYVYYRVRMKPASDTDQVIGGRYALEKPVGKGGMGEVWRARHLALKSPVAIKFLHGASASNDASRKRFLTEAQVTASLKTRHAVHVFDYGVTDGGVPYLVMELLEGETLDARIGRLGRVPIKSAVRLLRQAARALDRAHALGIVHRDFKPENIVILEDEEGNDEVKVLDFGVAKLIGELEPSHDADDDAFIGKNPMTTFTRTGTMIGTPYYMAPEQIKDSSQVGPPADLWALGVVAYECLTGVRPFEGDTVAEVLRSIIERNYAPASVVEPSIPVLFDDWFQAICASTAAARFPDALTAVVALGIAVEDPIPNPTASDPQTVTDLTAGFRILPQIRPSTGALAETLVAASGGGLAPVADSGIRTQPSPAGRIAEEASQSQRSVSGLSGSSRPPPASRVPVILAGAAAGCAVAALGFAVFGNLRGTNDARPASVAPEAATATVAAAPAPREDLGAATSQGDPSRPSANATANASAEGHRNAPHPVAGGAPDTAAPHTAPGAPEKAPAPTASAVAPAVPPSTPTAEGAPRASSAQPPGPSPYKLPDLGL